jgi:hypothetical protein
VHPLFISFHIHPESSPPTGRWRCISCALSFFVTGRDSLFGTLLAEVHSVFWSLSKRILMGVLIFNLEESREWKPCSPRRGHCFLKAALIKLFQPASPSSMKNRIKIPKPTLSIIAEGRGRGRYQINSGPNPTSSSTTIKPHQRGENYHAHLVHPLFISFHIHPESSPPTGRWRCISCALSFFVTGRDSLFGALLTEVHSAIAMQNG